MGEGFYPKAAALYKKLLKVRPDDEPTQLQLAEISAKQGLLLDAKTYFNAVATKRRGRGDRAGTAEIVIRLGTLDPADIDARMAAASTVAEMGDEGAAATRFREIHDDLNEKGRTDEALAALREAVRLNPYDRDGRGILARAAVAAGDLEAARGYLDRETAGSDPALLMALAEIELRLGHLDEARTLLPELLSADRSLRMRLVDLAWSLTATHQDAAFVCADAVVDDYIAARQFDEAAAVLQEFSTRDCTARSVAAEADRGLRGRRPRVHDVRGADPVDRRLPRERAGDGSAGGRRRSDRARTVGEGTHRPVPPCAGHASGGRSGFDRSPIGSAASRRSWPTTRSWT